MILYKYPGAHGISSLSPPCLKVEMALRRTGEPFEVIKLRSASRVRRISPTGRLPVVEVDGRRIADSIVILDELERRFPGAGLHPVDPAERVRDRLWEHFVNDSLYWLGFYMRWLPPHNRERWLRTVLRRVPFYMRWPVRLLLPRRAIKRGRAVGVAGKTEQEVLAGLERGMEMVQAGLKGGPYLQGRDTPGRGDLACASFFVQTGFGNILPDAEARFRFRPALVEHTTRVFESCSMDLPAWLRERAAPEGAA